MEITTKTSRIIILRLTESEARDALHDPSALKDALFSSLKHLADPAKKNTGKVIRQNGQRPRKAIPIPKEPHRGKTTMRRECPHCHELKSPQGFYMHVRACGARQSVLAAED